MSVSLLLTVTTFGITPRSITLAVIYNITVSFALRFPTLAMPVFGSYVMPVRLESNDTKYKSWSSLSVTFTPVASDGPAFMT